MILIHSGIQIFHSKVFFFVWLFHLIITDLGRTTVP